MQKSAVKMLQEMPVFGGLTEDTLTVLVDQAKRITMPEGGFFCREGDPAASMFVLISGKVAVLKDWDGVERLLAHLGEGDCFGEMALMECGSRSASVKAIEQSESIEITLAMLHDLYKKDLAQFTMVQMNLGREVSRRLRDADRQLFQALARADRLEHQYRLRSI